MRRALAILMTVLVLSTGCGTITAFGERTRVENNRSWLSSRVDRAESHTPYSGVKESATFVGTVGKLTGEVPVILPLSLPLMAGGLVDMGLSLVADTIMLPAYGYNYYVDCGPNAVAPVKH